jgi:hypothetical protein
MSEHEQVTGAQSPAKHALTDSYVAQSFALQVTIADTRLSSTDALNPLGAVSGKIARLPAIGVLVYCLHWLLRCFRRAVIVN